MDAQHSFWSSPVILRAAAEGRYGTLVRATRDARGWTLAQVAERSHLSISALSRMETGQRGLSNVHHLRALSEILAIPAHLFGLVPVAPGAAESPGGVRPVTVGTTISCEQDGGEAMRRRQVLAGLAGFTLAGALPSPLRAGATEESLETLLLAKTQLPAAPVPLLTLHQALDHAQHAFEHCQYRELTSALPQVIATAHASRDAATGHLRERMSAVLARSYLLGSELATKRQRDPIAWVAADRAHAAAEESGDPLAIAAGSRAMAIAIRRHALAAPDQVDREAGLTGAITMLTKTALDLGADHGDPQPQVLATYGSLLCTASYSAAQNGNAAQAIGLIEEAEHAARRLVATGSEFGGGTGNAQFSENTVAVYRIGVHTALGDSAKAVSYFDFVTPGRLPNAERRARCYVDGARAWNAHGNLDHATSALRGAFACAPQELQRPSVRSLITTMLDTPGPTPAALPELAAHAGV